MKREVRHAHPRTVGGAKTRSSRVLLGQVFPAAALALGLVLVGGTGHTGPAPPPERPDGPAPVVEATEIEAGEASFQASFDAPAAAPDHPPIDQIPPMPMPDEAIERPAASGPGAGVLFDPVTGETREQAMDFTAAAAGFEVGGGYGGADGGGGVSDIDRPLTFSNMSLISTASRANHPWRMNVKLVMRFGSSYFVCSGTMRDPETVLTAGHCVFDYGGAGWADQIWIYPGWDGVGSLNPGPPSITNPYGWAQSAILGSWTGWTQSGDLNYDVGLIGVTRAVGMLTGWFGWAYGGSCSDHTSRTYQNASYPAEGCGQPGLHNGRDMYFWSGMFDSCPSSNRLQIDTSGGCFNAGWGGMSGSGAYFTESSSRYVHAVASTSDRATFTRYARQFQDWVSWTNDTFLPQVRGASFDLQALDVNAGPATIPAGSSTTLLNHLATNATNGAAAGSWTVRVYLSTNDNISSGDTLLSTQGYSHSFAPMSSSRVNMSQVTIPSNTAPGSYYLGVEYDPVTDGDSSNNDTDGWDAVAITVTKPDLDITTLSAPSSARPGDTISVLNSVRNIGNATAGSFSLGLYLSSDSICTTGDDLRASRTVSSLAPNATSTLSTSVLIPAGTSLGTKYICGIADRLGQVAESNENNNTAFDAITIVQPDLQMTVVNAPPSASPGDTIAVSNTVQNSGTGDADSFRVGLYLSPDAACHTSDTFLTSRFLSSLAAGASSAQSTSVTLPPAASGGTQFVCAIADDLSQVAESNEANNTRADPINIVLMPKVNLKVNGADAVYPGVVDVRGPLKLTIDMTAGSTPLDHYYALIWGGTVYWVTPGGLSLTPAPLSTFAPAPLMDFPLLDTTLPAGYWGFAWLMLDGSTVVHSDVIVANVIAPSSTP